jgi:hypothetical protein
VALTVQKHEPEIYPVVLERVDDDDKRLCEATFLGQFIPSIRW